MNRENKKKSYKKGYYKSHACNESFTCKVCGRLVVPNGAGSDHRNHCPYCLSSQHLDIEPGDREADCGGTMEPVTVMGSQKRRMGDYSPLQNLRNIKLKQNCR